MYIDGKGVEKDPSTAAQWFLKAARQNHTEAQFRLGEMYKNGLGVKANTKEAKIWLAKAADGGLSKASRILKDILDAEDKRILGKEVETLRNSPIYPYLLSAKKGDTEAKYQVGVMFLEGEEAPKDVIEGVRWLQSAAIGDHTQAQLKLGEIYLTGAEKVERDYLVAHKWLKKAAESGQPDAQYHLGDIYRKGLGVQKSNAEAVKWFRLAAKQGHNKARKQLGGCKIC
jgi:TPR repeat protein